MDELAIVGAASAAAIGLGYYMTSGGEGKIEPLVDPLKQTKKLPVSYFDVSKWISIEKILKRCICYLKNDLQDGSRISRYIKDGVLLKYLFDDATTLYEVIRSNETIFLIFIILIGMFFSGRSSRSSNFE